MSLRAHPGARLVSTGFSPRNIAACDLPSTWMLPIGYSKSPVRVSRTRMDAGRRSPAIGQPEREPPQDHGNHRGGGVEDRQADPGVLEWPGAERGDAVADLIKGDHPARDGGRHDRELFLSEADRQGE